MLFESARH
jgi:calcium-dependent protein kinase